MIHKQKFNKLGLKEVALLLRSATPDELSTLEGRMQTRVAGTKLASESPLDAARPARSILKKISDEHGRRLAKVEREKLLGPALALDCRRVETVEQLQDLQTAILGSRFFGLDLETTGLGVTDQIVGISVAHDTKTGWYIPVRHVLPDGSLDPRNLPIDVCEAFLRTICVATQPQPQDPPELKRPRAVFWNARFDQRFLGPVTGLQRWHPQSFEDGMLSLYVRHPERGKADSDHRARRRNTGIGFGLKENVAAVLKMTQLEMSDVDERLYEGGYGLATLDNPRTVQYAASDSLLTLQLCTRVEILHRDPRSYAIDKRCAQTLSAMELRGILTDRELAAQVAREVTAGIEELQRQLDDIRPGLNVESSKQLTHYLFEDPAGLRLSVPTRKRGREIVEVRTDSGALSASADVLTQLAARPGSPEVLKVILKLKTETKILGYAEKVRDWPDPDGFVYASLSQTTARTSRIICSSRAINGKRSIPLHQVPRDPRIRNLIRAIPGYRLIKIDYSMQEFRTAANLSLEESWIKTFETGGDVHKALAAAAFKIPVTSVTKAQRDLGKTANFTLLYGADPYTLWGALEFAVPFSTCERLHRTFHETSPRYQAWKRQQYIVALRDGGIRTALGRFLRVDINEASARREAANYGVQGLCGGVLRCVLPAVEDAIEARWSPVEAHILLAVHDEILLQAREDCAVDVARVAKQTMERVPREMLPTFRVPLTCEATVVTSYGEKADEIDSPVKLAV